MLYLVCFCLTSCLFELIGERKKISKILKLLIVILAITIPSLIAGLRGASVGTDVQVYGINSFNLASSCNKLSEYYSYISIDYGFYLITYISSKIGNDYHIALFLYQFITMIFVYLFIKECHKKYGISMGIGCLFYLLLLFNNSLNIMRQSIAVAISAYAFTYLWKRKPIKYLLFMALAFSFHSTTIVGLLLWPLYLIFNKSKIGKPKQFFSLGIITFLIAVLLIFFNVIIENFVEIGILNVRYLNYIDGGKYSLKATSRPQISTTILQIILMIIVIFNSVRIDRSQKGGFYFFIITCLLVCFITIFASMIAAYIVRINYFFIPFQAIALALVVHSNKGKDKIGWFGIVFEVTFVLWFYTIIILNNHETYPYVFYWMENY